MSFRLWSSFLGALFVAGLLVGGARPFLGTSWSPGIDGRTGLRASVAVDTVDTTAAPDTTDVWMYAAGAILYARADDVPIRHRPSATASPVALVRATDPLVYLGEAKNGFLWVQFPGGLGWINARLVDRR